MLDPSLAWSAEFFVTYASTQKLSHFRPGDVYVQPLKRGQTAQAFWPPRTCVRLAKLALLDEAEPDIEGLPCEAEEICPPDLDADGDDKDGAGSITTKVATGREKAIATVEIPGRGKISYYKDNRFEAVCYNKVNGSRFGSAARRKSC